MLANKHKHTRESGVVGWGAFEVDDSRGIMIMIYTSSSSAHREAVIMTRTQIIMMIII